MATALREGQTAHLSATPDDPTGALDPNASVTWQETDASGNPASSGFLGAIAQTGPTTADVPWAASGQAFVVATATDPDGNDVNSAPFAIDCLSATDAASVSVTATVS